MATNQYVLTCPISVWQFDASYQDQRFIVEFEDNRRVMVSARMLDLIKLLESTHNTRQVAEQLSIRWGQRVSPTQVCNLIESVLVPLGLARPLSPTVSIITSRRSMDPLGHSFKLPLIPAHIVRHITPFLEPLYSWPVAIVGLLAVFLSRFIIYSRPIHLSNLGMEPAQYVYVFLLVLITVIAHEFGHATAISRWKGDPGDIGFTLYLFYPALYTDTSSSWKFDRWRRAAVDAGGAYFQLLCSLPIALIYLTTDNFEAFLTCVSIDSLLFFSLNPFFKFDGYWIISDIIGVPNLHANSVRHVLRVLRRSTSRKLDEPRTDELTRWSAAILLGYGGSLLLFIAILIYLTFTSGIDWVIQYPNLARDTYRRLAQISNEGIVTVTGITLQFVYRSLAVVGLIVFWSRLIKSVWKFLRRWPPINRPGESIKLGQLLEGLSEKTRHWTLSSKRGGNHYAVQSKHDGTAML